MRLENETVGAFRVCNTQYATSIIVVGAYCVGRVHNMLPDSKVI